MRDWTSTATTRPDRSDKTGEVESEDSHSRSWLQNGHPGVDIRRQDLRGVLEHPAGRSEE